MSLDAHDTGVALADRGKHAKFLQQRLSIALGLFDRGWTGEKVRQEMAVKHGIDKRVVKSVVVRAMAELAAQGLLEFNDPASVKRTVARRMECTNRMANLIMARARHLIGARYNQHVDYQRGLSSEALRKILKDGTNHEKLRALEIYNKLWGLNKEKPEGGTQVIMNAASALDQMVRIVQSGERTQVIDAAFVESAVEEAEKKRLT